MIGWVYKVVKEALKKSEKIHVVFFKVIVNTHEVVAKLTGWGTNDCQ